MMQSLVDFLIENARRLGIAAASVLGVVIVARIVGFDLPLPSSPIFLLLLWVVLTVAGAFLLERLGFDTSSLDAEEDEYDMELPSHASIPMQDDDGSEIDNSAFAPDWTVDSILDTAPVVASPVDEPVTVTYSKTKPHEADELAMTLKSFDDGTWSHSERVADLAVRIGEDFGLDDENLERLEYAALLHDIGKLYTAPALLSQAELPDEKQWRLLQKHPEDGGLLIQPLRAWLGEWADSIEQHHEFFDGQGYPKGLQGEAISLGGRIVAVAEAFDVMINDQPYRRALSMADATEELQANAGTQFDPAVVRVLLAALDGGYKPTLAKKSKKKAMAMASPGASTGMLSRFAASGTAAAILMASALTANALPSIGGDSGRARLAADAEKRDGKKGDDSFDDSPIFPGSDALSTPIGAAEDEFAGDGEFPEELTLPGGMEIDFGDEGNGGGGGGDDGDGGDPCAVIDCSDEPPGNPRPTTPPPTQPRPTQPPPTQPRPTQPPPTQPRPTQPPPTQPQLQNFDQSIMSAFGTVLGRRPDNQAGQSYQAQRAAGKSDEWVVNSVMASGESKSRNGSAPSADQWAVRFYANNLCRTPNASEQAYWRGQIQQLGVAKAALKFGALAEPKAKQQAARTTAHFC